MQIDGRIDAFSASSITVGGVVIAITPDTQFVGTVEVGRLAHVRALQSEDGSLIAKVVAVDEPPTPAPTAEPTATPEASPTATPEASPTPTPEATTTPTS